MKLRSLSRLLPALVLLGAPACALDASEPAPNELDTRDPTAPEHLLENWPHGFVVFRAYFAYGS